MSVVSEAPRAATRSSGQGLGIPFALILLAVALAAVGYLVFSAVRAGIRRVAGPPLDVRATPFYEDEETVRVLQRTTDDHLEPVAPPPTQEIGIDDGRVWVELTTVPDIRETHTEADIYTRTAPQKTFFD